MSTPRDPHADPPGRRVLLIDARGLAALVDLSERTIWRLHAAGKLPRPVVLGGSTRWRADEIARWIEAGCPARAAWEARGRA
jgi:predicted DNA-binding transcriptional regulator AlpA